MSADLSDDRVYWPQLDGLRFVAFLMVYLFHGGLPQFEGWVCSLALWLPGMTALKAIQVGSQVQSNGWVGVRLFFILSGFLITALLLREEARFGRIDLRAFWVRRLLRIWPLYYLILILGFGILPRIQGVAGTEAFRFQLSHHLPAFLAFLGNWSIAVFGPAWSNTLTVLWSVCVEEQFYLVAPLLIVWVPRKARLPVVVGLMAVSVLVRGWMVREQVNALLIQFGTLGQLDTLLSGVALALLMDRVRPGPRASRLAGWFQAPLLILFGWLLTWPHLAQGSAFHRTWDLVWIWMTGAGLIAVVLLHRGLLCRFLGHRWLVWLGRISYGLYMYHEITILVSRWIIPRLIWIPNRKLFVSVVYLTLTVAVSAASYYGFERPFLRLKNRWTRVPSRPV